MLSTFINKTVIPLLLGGGSFLISAYLFDQPMPSQETVLAFVFAFIVCSIALQRFMPNKGHSAL